MSVWQQYAALADYISLKYQSELHLILGTTTSIIDQELGAHSRGTSEHHSRADRQHFYHQLQRILVAIRSAPAVSTYQRTAHTIHLSPEILRGQAAVCRRPSQIKLLRAPPRSSVFAQKAELREWHKDLLQEDLCTPELAFSLV